MGEPAACCADASAALWSGPCVSNGGLLSTACDWVKPILSPQSGCNPKPVWLPAATKASAREAAADVKEHGLFADAGHLEDEGRTSQSPSPPLSGGRGFHKEGEGSRTERSREGVEKFSACRWAQSILIREVMFQCTSSWLSHPGFTLSPPSSHPGSTDEGQQISWNWDAWRSDMFIYQPHISQSPQTQRPKNGGAVTISNVTIFHCHKVFRLLQPWPTPGQ